MSQVTFCLVVVLKYFVLYLNLCNKSNFKKQMTDRQVMYLIIFFRFFIIDH